MNTKPTQTKKKPHPRNIKTGSIGIEPFARTTDSTKPERATIIVKQYVNLQHNNEYIQNGRITQHTKTKTKRQPDKIQ